MADRKIERAPAEFEDTLTLVGGSGTNKTGHLISQGTAPTASVTTAGNGTCVISASSTDIAGDLTFAATWADGDTVVVAFANAYATAPKVILSNAATFTSAGISTLEIDTIAVTTAGFTLTASGTCAGVLTYMVVETV